MSNEQITLHSQSLDQIEGILRKLTEETANPTPETIANTIAAQRRSPNVAVGFCGLPGAGKSKAVEIFAELTGGEAISMGDAIRREFVRQNVPGVAGPHSVEMKAGKIDSTELAEFAAEARDEDAAQIPQWVTDIAEESNATVFAIDGVRSMTDYEVLNSYFDEFRLVQIQAPFYERLDRLRERGREGEGTFGPEDLLERDEHERTALGYGELVDHDDEWAEEFLPETDFAEYDTEIINMSFENNAGLWQLEQFLSDVLRTYTWLPEPEEGSPIATTPKT